MTARDYCISALQELGVYGPSDVPSAEDIDFALQRLNRLFDRWTAEQRPLYVDNPPADYVLTPNLNPHTIGPTGTFVVTPRPVQILNAAVVLNAGSVGETLIPITIQDRAWYASARAPRVTTALPTDLYYAKDVPDGRIYFYGLPSSAFPVRLWTRKALTAVALDTVIVVADGYWDAIVLSLAEGLLTAFPRKTIAEALITNARQARATAFALNDDVSLRLGSDAPSFGGGGGGKTLIVESREV